MTQRVLWSVRWPAFILIVLGGRLATAAERTERFDKDPAWPGHFNRFGLITTHTDGNGQLIYFDDLTYTWTQAK
jgi:hypothetical protein